MMPTYFDSVNTEIDRIADDLRDLPTQLYEADIECGAFKRNLDELNESLDFAETAALMNAVIDGKNDAARKLQQAQVLAQDSEVKRCKQRIRQQQSELDQATIKTEQLRRRFASECYIAQMRAAQLNSLSAQPN